MSRRTSAENERRYHLNFRTSEEKQDAADFSKTRGFESLNAYMLYLYRQDKRVHSVVVTPGLESSPQNAEAGRRH
jgi:hypothetical protein